MTRRRTFLATLATVAFAGCSYHIPDTDSDYLESYTVQQVDPTLHLRFETTDGLEKITVAHNENGVWDTREVNGQLTIKSIQYPAQKPVETIEEYEIRLQSDTSIEEAHPLVLPEYMK